MNEEAGSEARGQTTEDRVGRSVQPDSQHRTSETAANARRLKPSTLAWTLAALCLLLFFFRLGSVPLFDLDEALYVTCAQQMVVSGDYRTPRLNSRPHDRPDATAVAFFEKPILVYWLSAGSMRLFGRNEWAARLPSALAALLTTGLIVLAGRRWFGWRAGLLAGLVYATAPMTVLDARQMTTDGLLTLWLTLALVSGQRAVARGTRNPYHLSPTRYSSFFWLFAGLAVLTKGIIGLLLPMLVFSVYLALDRVGLRLRASAARGLVGRFRLRWNRAGTWWPAVRAFRPLLGLLLFLAIVAPWHVAMAGSKEKDAQGRTFTQEYIIRQHVGRFRGGDVWHNAPIFTYALFFLIGFFPWAGLTPAAFRIPTGTPAETEAHRFLLVWFWTIFLFFSLSAAKLPTYIVPAYPAAALLVGRWLDRALLASAEPAEVRSLRRAGMTALLVAGLLVAAALAGPRLVPANAPIPPDLARLTLWVTLLMFAGCLIAWACFQRGGQSARGRRAGIAAWTGTMAGFVGIAATAGYALADRDLIGTYQRLAAAARADAEAGLPVVYYNIVPRRPSMLFYAGYAPFERKETPLRPFLRDTLPTAREMDILTSTDTYETKLRPELAVAPEFALRPLRSEGGWILLRLTRQP
jgi:4-amino-4-deoxy-L-arabinose transferase-like glycosyltransferase